MVKYNIKSSYLCIDVVSLSKRMCFKLSSNELSHGIKFKVSCVQAVHEYAKAVMGKFFRRGPKKNWRVIMIYY